MGRKEQNGELNKEDAQEHGEQREGKGEGKVWWRERSGAPGKWRGRKVLRKK